ncbi:IclR family transcriptional regulator [Streptomyces sp. NPDC002276]
MQLVKRTLNVLEVLSQERDGLTFQQICDRLDVPIASMHRLLAVLREQQFITRSETSRRYFIGLAAWEIGTSAKKGVVSVADRSHRELSHLAEEAREVVLLSELSGNQAVCTARVNGNSGTGISTQVGKTLPIHATSAGRTLLADMPAHQVRRLFAEHEFTPFTSRTPRGVHEVLQHLLLTRRHGYGVSYDEFESEVWSLSAPVRDGSGQIQASVTVVALGSHVEHGGTRDRIRSLVLESADLLAADLGSSAPAPATVRPAVPIGGQPCSSYGASRTRVAS